VLNALPTDYIEKGPIANGPKAYFTGLAQQEAGNGEAARSDWQTALQVVEQRLKTQPGSIELHGWRALLLAQLGERADGEEASRIYEQLVETDGADAVKGYRDLRRVRVACIKATLGHQDEVVADLMKIHSQPSPGLRYSPEWDCLRGNPRFQAWLKSNPPKESK
jgi:hypothetical protein